MIRKMILSVFLIAAAAPSAKAQWGALRVVTE